MKSTRGVLFLAAAIAAGASARPAAHRLDEYLQATLVSVDRDRISLEISLTPGVAISGQVVASIDRNGDGLLSLEEQDAYAASVMTSVDVQIDGRTVPVALTSRTFPAIERMHEGLGVIRLNATAAATSGPGAHQIVFRNRHRPDLSVYLANTLVPSDRDIEIGAQHRDVNQRELRVDFRVKDSVARRLPQLVAASLASLLVVALCMFASFK